MPACLQCKWRVENHCSAYDVALKELKRTLPPPPSGACTIAIVDTYLHKIQKGMRVLEVGCGTWSKILDHCKLVGAQYEGLDVQKSYYGIPCIATRFENISDLSFKDEEFDVVIGNQTMEHWAENGCTLEWGLYQCFRVLKNDGLLLINVPIHFHGTKEFVHGDIKKISQIFSKFSSLIKMESWGNPSEPLRPFFAHPNFKDLQNKPAYVLNIIAKKNKALPLNIRNTFGFKGKLAQLFHYSISYNFYRLKSKVLYGSNS